MFVNIIRILIGPSEAEAQGVCWRHTSVDCPAIIATEIGYRAAFSQSTRTMTVHYDTTTYKYPDTGFNSDFGWEFAYLRHTGKTWMAGPALQLGWDDNGERTAVKARVRHYINRRDSWEVSAGLLRSHFDFDQSSTGVTADARFNVSDYVSFTAAVESAPWPVPPNLGSQTYSTDKTHTSAVKLGISAGSLPAAVATGIVVIGVGLVISALAHGLN